MKTSLPIAFPAAFVAFLFLPVSFELGASVLVAARFLAIAVCDYRQPLRRLTVSDRVGVTLSRKERFGLAA